LNTSETGTAVFDDKSVSRASMWWIFIVWEAEKEKKTEFWGEFALEVPLETPVQTPEPIEMITNNILCLKSPQDPITLYKKPKKRKKWGQFVWQVPEINDVQTPKSNQFLISSCQSHWWKQIQDTLFRSRVMRPTE
jgi:hypothetical protein